MQQAVEYSFTLEDGRTLTIETGKLARQANGAVVVRMGKAVLLATVVGRQDEGTKDFLPLSVDYQERYASSGRFPGGFLKREGPLSTHEILISRLVDRALRPLFPEGYFGETQLNILLLSADKEVMPDALACLAASAALLVSDIPYAEPAAEVRICRIQGQWALNPAYDQLENADIELMVGGTLANITMVEGECSEVSEEGLLEAIEIAHGAIRKLCRAQLELAAMAGPKPKWQVAAPQHDEALRNQIHKLAPQVEKIIGAGLAKNQRSEQLAEVLSAVLEDLQAKEQDEKLTLAKAYFKDLLKSRMREQVLAAAQRLDGRKLEEVRPIECSVDYLPVAHGSAVFTRGETQSLTSVTLGSSRDEMLIDGATLKATQKFMLHYNFPGFSTGEIKFNRGPGRREVGHGNLAQRALKNMVPAAFPYTIRVVSDILESNGSSSMATVCAGSLALMDAGVPLKAAVAGIAMGLIADGNRYAVLSDITADEDHLGDMDFKVTGTQKGITACQMDIKTSGIPAQVMLEALKQARRGCLHILSKMDEAVQTPRAEVKAHVPRIERITFPSSFMGSIIGPGGKVIQELQKSTGTTLKVQEEDAEAWMEIFAPDVAALEAVRIRLKEIIALPEEGETYSGAVKGITSFGAFVEILPGKEGLLHVTELAWEGVGNVEDILKIGDTVAVKLVKVDEKTGKMTLSRKALLPKPVLD